MAARLAAIRIMHGWRQSRACGGAVRMGDAGLLGEACRCDGIGEAGRVSSAESALRIDEMLLRADDSPRGDWDGSDLWVAAAAWKPLLAGRRGDGDAPRLVVARPYDLRISASSRAFSFFARSASCCSNLAAEAARASSAPRARELCIADSTSRPRGPCMT